MTRREVALSFFRYFCEGRISELGGLLACIACVGALAGCGETGVPLPAGTARDSAGIRIIDLPPSSHTASAVELTLDVTWAPGAGLEIGSLGDVAVASGGRILLLDELGVNVTVLSPDGEPVAVIGRAGQGPGEFDPQGLSRLVLSDSSVFVPDLFLQRLTEFTLEGEVLGMLTFPSSPVYAMDWRRHPGGGLAFRAFEPSGDRIIRLTGEAADTLFSLPFSNDVGNLLLAPALLWDLTPEGELALARSDEAVVELRKRGSDSPVWRARWADLPEEMGPGAVAHLESVLTESILRDAPSISAEGLAQNLASVSYPDRAPALAGILAAPSGDIWVRRVQPVGSMGREALRVGSAEGYGGRDWDVLDRGGFLRARVRLPEGFTPRRFMEGWIYGILANDLGVERPARVRWDGWTVG